MISWEQLGDINIMIVEDDPFNRLLIRSMLGNVPQINFYEAYDGFEALETLAQHSIDILLLDLHMPKMNGYETLIEIKKNIHYQNIAILAMTTDEEEKKEFYSRGADEFISKPFKVEELEMKIFCTLKERKELKALKKLKEAKDFTQTEVEKKEEVFYSKTEVELSQKDFFLKFISIKTKAHPEERNKVKVISSLVKTFALKLGYDKSTANNIYYATLIRDIGLCGFSPSNTSDYQKEYHQYILMGYQTISNNIETDFIKIAKKVILQYHECYDGSGTPYGIKKDEISKEAHLVFIVENFEKLLSKKSQEKQHVYTPENVYNLLYAQSAKKFNPKLLAVFLKSFSEFIQLRQKLLTI